jgi:hypothetical protein
MVIVGIVLFIVFFILPALAGLLARKPEYNDTALQNQGE